MFYIGLFHWNEYFLKDDCFGNLETGYFLTDDCFGNLETGYFLKVGCCFDNLETEAIL